MATDKSAATQRLQRRLRRATDNSLPPTLVGMEFVRYVLDTAPAEHAYDAAYTWAVYISHDPCHDGLGHTADRNTVLAFHRWNGTFKIIGRELPRARALALARGEALS